MSYLIINSVGQTVIWYLAHLPHCAQESDTHGQVRAVTIAHAAYRVDGDSLEAQGAHRRNDSAEFVCDDVVVGDEAGLGGRLNALEALSFVPVGASVAEFVQGFL